MRKINGPLEAPATSVFPILTVPCSQSDIRRALEAGFTPDEVEYMFALDVPAPNVEIEIDGVILQQKRA